MGAVSSSAAFSVPGTSTRYSAPGTQHAVPTLQLAGALPYIRLVASICFLSLNGTSLEYVESDMVGERAGESQKRGGGRSIVCSA